MNCKGDGCILSLKCKRYLPESKDVFSDSPYRVIDGETKCDYFINLVEHEDTRPEQRDSNEDDKGGIE